MLDIYTSKLRQNSFNTLASSLVLLDLYWSEPRRNFNREQAALLHLSVTKIAKPTPRPRPGPQVRTT